MRVSPAVDQQCGYAPSTPNPVSRAHSVQRPGVAVTRRLIASTNKMVHPNRPAPIPGSIPPTCTSFGGVTAYRLSRRNAIGLFAGAAVTAGLAGACASRVVPVTVTPSAVKSGGNLIYGVVQP